LYLNCWRCEVPFAPLQNMKHLNPVSTLETALDDECVTGWDMFGHVFTLSFVFPQEIDQHCSDEGQHLFVLI